MILIGERINMTRKSIREKVHARDVEFIAEEARRQTAAGATHIDVNAGADPGREIDDMRWLVEVVAGATELPLSFDSANAAAIKAGLEMCNREGTIVNSTTAEAARLAETLPLVSEYKTNIIALTMDDDGMPEDYERRCRIVDKLAATFSQEAIGLDRVLFDTLVRPVSTNQDQVPFMLEAIRYVTEQYPEAHTVAATARAAAIPRTPIGGPLGSGASRVSPSSTRRTNRRRSRGIDGRANSTRKYRAMARLSAATPAASRSPERSLRASAVAM